MHRRILLNATPMGGVLSGVARYVRSVYQAISAEHLADVEYFFRGAVHRVMPEQGWGTPVRFVPPGLRYAARRLRFAVVERQLQRVLGKTAADVYHETGWFPVKAPSRIRTVFTIYDLSSIHFKECHPADRVRYFEKFFYKRVEAADHIITISEFVRRDIHDSLGIALDRITAIPLAADPVFRAREGEDVQRWLRARGLPQRYVLYVGTMEPRKNLARLVRALSAMKAPLPLLCVGGSGWLNEKFESEIRRCGLAKRVFRLGRCTDEELALLYSGAAVFAYPSLYEGFGLPVLEAMACGCPVVCSDRASLPEVVGNAAIRVSPEDDRALADALDRIIEDPGLTGELSRRGLDRAAEFSWQATARRTVEVFGKV